MRRRPSPAVVTGTEAASAGVITVVDVWRTPRRDLMTLHSTLVNVTRRIAERSTAARGDCLGNIEAARGTGMSRSSLACGNLAHGFAACEAHEKRALAKLARPNVGIVAAYNDMLSAHQPQVSSTVTSSSSWYNRGHARTVCPSCTGSRQR